MPDSQASVEARNALLDELKSALDDWHEREIKRIDDEVTFAKSVLRGRTGSERLARSNTTEARVLVIDDINSFLAGTPA
jgi:hypothetical protein